MKDRPHYVYELVRTSVGPGPTRYIGVRTAPSGDPTEDDYWSSSTKISKERAFGAHFVKTILQTFETREEAEFHEADLHWRHMVGKNPKFYNVISQLIEGRIDDLYPRQRYLSPNGEHLWFIPGHEPDGWRHDPAKWAQYKDLSFNDGTRSGFRYTFEGMEPSGWQFYKYYPDEMAFGSDEPLHGYRPYVQLDCDQKIQGFSFFPHNHQPANWIDGLPAYIITKWAQQGVSVPSGWEKFCWVADPEEAFFDISLSSEGAFFPKSNPPQGWITAGLFREWRKDTSDRQVYFRNEVYRDLKELEDIFMRSRLIYDQTRTDEKQLARRLRVFRRKTYNDKKRSDWIAAISKSTQLSEEEKARAIEFLVPAPVEIPTREAWLAGHLSPILAEAARLHKEAISHLNKPMADSLPQLHEAERLLGEAEILISGALSYFDSPQLNKALADLHRQQGQVGAMIIQLEARKYSTNTEAWVWIALLALLGIMAFVIF